MSWEPWGRETPYGEGWRSQGSISWRRKSTKFRQKKKKLKRRERIGRRGRTNKTLSKLSPLLPSLSLSLSPPLPSSTIPPSFPLPLTLSLPLPPPFLWLLFALCELWYKILSYCSRFITICFLPWRSWTNSLKPVSNPPIKCLLL